MIKKICLSLGLLLAFGQATAAIVFMDDFGTGQNSGNLTNIGPNWNVTSGRVDLWNFFSGQGYSIDLDGSGTNGVIESALAFTFTPGKLYELSFSYSNNVNAGNQLNYALGSIFSETLPVSIAGIPAFTTITKQFSVSVATMANISFAELGAPDFGGSIIDNVKLQDLGTVDVAEPSIFASLCLGLLSLMMIGRRNSH